MTTPANDADVLADVLLTRVRGRAPAWTRLRVNVADRVVEIRVPAPSDVKAWHAALLSAVEVREERLDGQGVVFHCADVTDWRSGWSIFVGCREDLKPSQREAEVPPQ